MSVLQINISNLPEGIHQRSLEATPEEIGLEGRFSREVKLAATLEKTSRQLLLRVELTIGGVFTCDRCLDEFEKDINSSYTMMYVTEERAAVKSEEVDVQVISPDTNFIDLGEDVRQYALLALPQKVLCRDECAGLCPVCGANRNRTTCNCRREEIDPRWEGLRKFLEN